MSPTRQHLSVILAVLSCAGAAQAQTTATCTVVGVTGCNPVVSDASDNTAVGQGALLFIWTSDGLPSTTIGKLNTAVGAATLLSNTSGNNNTATGGAALESNTTGSSNTATGTFSLFSNTTGGSNTATGFSALFTNTTGTDNTAVGANALQENTTGNGNTAVGGSALFKNTTGAGNTALGENALLANTTGGNNTAFGRQVLAANTLGFGNAAQGFNALLANTSGYRNTAVGNDALETNLTGFYNTAVGFQAGLNITGSYNIDIGNTGVAGDHNTIRIGATSAVPGDSSNNVITATYIGGIFGAATNSTNVAAVYVDSTGHLFSMSSSERFKTAVAPMADVSERLAKLQPVTFLYKTDPSGTVQYGLIAEEVDKVYPELVIHDDQGRIQGVRYEELAPMLLSEVQKDHEHALAQDAEISALKAQLAEMHSVLVSLQSKGDHAAP